jgi:hypothetical protein
MCNIKQTKIFLSIALLLCFRFLHLHLDFGFVSVYENGGGFHPIGNQLECELTFIEIG